jgi:hypothetical protein
MRKQSTEVPGQHQRDEGKRRDRHGIRSVAVATRLFSKESREPLLCPGRTRIFDDGVFENADSLPSWTTR